MTDTWKRRGQIAGKKIDAELWLVVVLTPWVIAAMGLNWMYVSVGETVIKRRDVGHGHVLNAFGLDEGQWNGGYGWVGVVGAVGVGVDAGAVGETL